MFGSTNKKEAGNSKGNTSMPSGTHSLNSLVQGAMVEGTVKSENDIRVDGAIKGKLFCDAKVIIGPTGTVEGEIRCQNAVIEGKFEGAIEVNELLNVRESANISGEVVTNKLIVQSGAVFNVTCNMGSGKLSRPGRQPEKTSENNKEKTDVVTAGKAAGAK